MGFTITASVAGDLAALLLAEYVRGDTIKQTIQDKPLLKLLTDNKKTFSGGNGTIKNRVQGAFISDSNPAVGYSGITSLEFQTAANALATSYTWCEHHFGLHICWTELKEDGISIVGDTGTTVSKHSKRDLYVLGGVLDNRMQDFGESWSRILNRTLWLDGTQDSNAVDGLQSIILDDTTANTTVTTGGQPRTYTWWRNRILLGIAPSPTTQTLTRTMQPELRQLRRYGGNPTAALCGSDWLTALEQEAHAKGMQTMTGFSQDNQMKLGFGQVSYVGLGTFTYDPTMDDLGRSKFCYVIDPKRLVLRPMEQEWNKVITPTRPYDYAVYFQSMFSTMALECTQLNAQGVYSVA